MYSMLTDKWPPVGGFEADAWAHGRGEGGRRKEEREPGKDNVGNLMGSTVVGCNLYGVPVRGVKNV